MISLTFSISILQVDFGTFTKQRLLMEKRFYLNASNSKYVTVGVSPSPKLLNMEGFHVVVTIGGSKMKPMTLAGLDGFLTLCRSLRSMDELKYVYPNTAGDYSQIAVEFPISISSRPYFGRPCFFIETVMQESSIMAQSTCQDLLKIERLIIAACNKLQSLVETAEKEFNALITKSAVDLPKAMSDVIKSEDLMLIEIITNFNDLFKMCIDAVTAGSANTPAASTSPRKAPKPRTRGQAKSTKVQAAAVATGGVDFAETNNSVDLSEEAETDAGINESGEQLGPVAKRPRVQSKAAKALAAAVASALKKTKGDADHSYAVDFADDSIDLSEETESNDAGLNENGEHLGLVESGQRMTPEHYL